MFIFSSIPPHIKRTLNIQKVKALCTNDDVKKKIEILKKHYKGRRLGNTEIIFTSKVIFRVFIF